MDPQSGLSPLLRHVIQWHGTGAFGQAHRQRLPFYRPLIRWLLGLASLNQRLRRYSLS